MTSQSSRILLLMLAVVAVLIFAFLVTRHIDNRESMYVSVRSLTRADIAIEDLSFIQTHMGEVEWKIQAKSAELFDKDKKIMIADAKIMLKTPQGLEIYFTGDQGMINTERHDFKIQNQQDDIKIRINNKYTILTRKLEWDNEQKEISSDRRVRILGPQFTIEGVGLSVKITNQEMKIVRDVHATLHE